MIGLESAASTPADPDVARQGLSEPEAQSRLRLHGPNALEVRQGIQPWRLLLRQFTSSTVLLLAAACIASLALGDLLDALAILAILILNAAIGFRQEYGAERAMEALRQLTEPLARVRRDGLVRELPTQQLVPGDVALLEAGDVVPADGRLLLAVGLRTQEAALTGESEAVDKLAVQGEQGQVFAGTAVLVGRGELLVTATGMGTRLGQIASLVQRAQDGRTPLERKLEQLSRTLALAALAIVAVVFAMGVWRGEPVSAMFLTAVSLAVAAVPEGLPAVVTIALALGAQRMLRRNALVRRLNAVETLGSVTVICSDKTGTLTENRMTVVMLDVAGHRQEIREALREHQPRLEAAGTPVASDAAMRLLLLGGALCNDASLERQADGAIVAVGDPTEGALLVAAAHLIGLHREQLERQWPRVNEQPFDAERKRMTTVHTGTPETQDSLPWHTLPPATHVAFSKGATDRLLEVATRAWVDGQMTALTPELRTRIQQAHDTLARNGMRVLAVAFRLLEADQVQATDLEHDLVFVGMFGLEDPARPEARQAISDCQTAGIRPVMITGDHPLTARSIAAQLGMVESATTAHVITGNDLDRFGPTELRERVDTTSIFARVSPAHKLEIVRAFQEHSHIVAMTGDGVNDAPALEQADIGVAMGLTGTAVAKESAEIVLKDDHFATIVAAVEEGRIVFENIRKFVRYILTGNIGELLVMLCAPLLGMPLPLTALQILWINLVTDGLPALALTLEPVEEDTMRRPPRPPGESLFARGLGRRVLLTGGWLGALALGVGYVFWSQGLESWRTMTFSTLTFAQMAGVLAMRSDHDALWRTRWLSNPPLLASVAVTLVLQLLVLYVPPLAGVLGTVALTVNDLLLCIGLSLLVPVVIELEKWWQRRQGPRSTD